jgi:hypothetical protein
MTHLNITNLIESIFGKIISIDHIANTDIIIYEIHNDYIRRNSRYVHVNESLWVNKSDMKRDGLYGILISQWF